MADSEPKGLAYVEQGAGVVFGLSKQILSVNTSNGRTKTNTGVFAESNRVGGLPFCHRFGQSKPLMPVRPEMRMSISVKPQSLCNDES
jgi:hypothetical protein